MGINKIVKDYMQERFDALEQGLMTFNYVDDTPLAISMITSYSGRTVKNYIRSADKEYGFSLILSWPYSTETDDLNVQAMDVAQELIDWIEEQNKLGNYPDLGRGRQVKSIDVLQNMPNQALIDWENMRARYMVQCRILYHEQK